MLTQTRNDRHAAIGTSMKTKTGRCSRVPHAPTQLINKVHYSGFNSLLHQMIYMDGQQNTYTSFINFLTVTFQALQLFLKKMIVRSWSNQRKLRKWKCHLRSVCKEKEGAHILIVHLENKTRYLWRAPSKILKQPAKTTKREVSAKICMQGKWRRADFDSAPRKQNSVSLTIPQR